MFVESPPSNRRDFKRKLLTLLSTSAGFLHGLLLDHEGGRDLFFRNIGLSPHTALKPKSQHSSAQIFLNFNYGA
jgi:hypothetical protein